MKLHWIEDNALAAGGIPVNAADIESLKSQGVGSILTLTENPITTFREIDLAKLQALDIDYLHVPVNDHHAPTVEQASVVAQYVNRMKAENKPVYLHCAAGIGRTGTMLHAYYLVQGLTLDEAKRKVKAGKPSSQYFMLSTEQKLFIDALARDLAKVSGTVLETVYFLVIPGKESAFMEAIQQVSAILSASEAHISHELQRATDDNGRYLMLIRWQLDNDPDTGFLHPELYSLWQPLLHKLLFDDPLVERYQPITIA